MGFFIRWFWSKLKFILLRVPTNFKNDQDKTVITSIQSVWVTRPSRSDLGAISAHLGQACGSCHKFCGFEATMRQNKYELICFRTAFCFVIFFPPDIAQKCICIQNLGMNLSFQDNFFFKFYSWLLRYEATSWGWTGPSSARTRTGLY